MKTRERFLYMMLGGVFSAVLIFVGMAVSPLTAQRDTFGEITCTGLRVLYPDGTVAVYLGQSDDGGEVTCYDTAGKTQVAMQSSKYGAGLTLLPTGDNTGIEAVTLGVNERDGYISIVGETGRMMLDNDGFSMVTNSTVLGLEINSRGHPLFRIGNVSNKDKVQKVEIEVTASGLLTLWENDEFEGLGLLNYLTRP